MAGRSVIVAGARTPIGKLSGALSSLTAMDLGGYAIAAALAKAGISGDQVEHVIMGHVIQAAQGQITARQAAVKGGIPMNVPSITINKVCLSGLNAIGMADVMIRSGEAEVIVAGGMESMTGAPYLLPKARGGYRYGNAEVLDATFHDALFDAFDHVPMGEGTERDPNQAVISRGQQDEFAARSHELAARAQKDGTFDAEIVPISIKQRKGDPLVISQDEGVRAETTPQSLAALKPAFTEDGTITAGNASQISDGGCALVIMSPEKAASLGLTVLAEIGAHGMVAGPGTGLHHQPANAIEKAAQREGIAIGDIDLFELNEAFASVGIASAQQLGASLDKINVNGGAIALGHPVGMSGARIALHLILELGRRGGGVGAAGLCGGGGQGDGLLFHVPAA
jgi:acetyl-CoA C-acetyltransferase